MWLGLCWLPQGHIAGKLNQICKRQMFCSVPVKCVTCTVQSCHFPKVNVLVLALALLPSKSKCLLWKRPAFLQELELCCCACVHHGSGLVFVIKCKYSAAFAGEREWRWRLPVTEEWTYYSMLYANYLRDQLLSKCSILLVYQLISL